MLRLARPLSVKAPMIAASKCDMVQFGLHNAIMFGKLDMRSKLRYEISDLGKLPIFVNQ